MSSNTSTLFFTNQVTINIDVGYGEIDGSRLGRNGPWRELRAAVPARKLQLGTDYPAVGGRAGFLDIAVEISALRQFADEPGGSAGFGFDLGNFDQLCRIQQHFALQLRGKFQAVIARNIYFVGTVEHEITEDMGRVSLLNEQPRNYSPIDLFRYSAPGVRDVTTGSKRSTAYFSINSGDTDLGTWNNHTKMATLPTGMENAFRTAATMPLMTIRVPAW